MMTGRMFASVVAAGLAVAVLPTSNVVAQPIVGTSRYEFAARRHLDDLAFRLWQDANSICWEMYRHYGHNYEFRETYREMYRVMQDARHVHDLVHEGYHYGHHDVDHIAQDLCDIDRLFHRIEDCIRGWTPSYAGHYGHYYHGDYGRRVHGHSYGNRLTRKMRYFEQTLHHLMADYGVTSQVNDEPADNATQAPPIPTPNVLPSPQLPTPTIPK